MSEHEPAEQDMSCTEFVELVTAYLDDALPHDQHADVEAHLKICEGCRNVLAQWRTVIALAGRLAESNIDATDPLTRDRLMSTFRGIRRR